MKEKISRILLVVPVNTISNWINEFKIWCDDINLTPLSCYNLNDTNSNSMARGIMIQTWVKNGGILLTSNETLARTCKSCLNEKSYNGNSYILANRVAYFVYHENKRHVLEIVRPNDKIKAVAMSSNGLHIALLIEYQPKKAQVTLLI